jgi:hypothetical protein
MPGLQAELAATVTFAVPKRSLPLRMPRVPVLLLKERVLDFIMNTEEPCFCASGAIAEMCGLGLEISSPFLGGAQLKRKLVRQIHGPGAVVLRHLGCLLQQGDNGTPGIIGYDVGVRLVL